MLKINIEKVDYGETFSIADAELCVAKGEILCLLGHNGAGKTTMIHALCGVIDYKGSVFLEGEAIDFDNDQLIDRFKSAVCYIPDDVNLFEFLTPKELFALNKATYKEQFESAFLQQLITLFEIEKYLHMPIANLSHGNKKKVQLVSQICKKPSYIIFDEPTNGLDPDMIIVLRKMLLFLKSNDIGIVLSTHHLSFAENLYDHMMIIRNGEIKLQASKNEVDERFSDKSIEEIYQEVNQAYYHKVDELIHALY